ncbi:ribbon-helix-helix domain-containing protein [Candidatus Woesearchaeota archaeon]|nr:ribbon-helix-helix domain-containing protein [Candidatus Woesearchaeota archaeon]MBW2994650.1 ribbon-helix-helix domain-containing protein [Candidatus Woesearchaeota archaeon]
MGELVHLRLEKQLKKRMNDIVKTGMFANMTEFIRDAIRKNIEEYEKQRAIRGLELLRGKGRLLTKAEQKKVKDKLKKMSPSEIFRSVGLD